MKVTKENINNFWKRVEKTDNCWIWRGGVNSRGYGNFAFRKNGKVINNRAHRFAYILSEGKVPLNLMVCHKCNNPLCVRPDHLYMGSGSDNVQDAIISGLWNPPQGEKNGMSKLTEKEVRKIRKMFASGNYYQKELANIFGVMRENISQIVNKRSWAHI